MWGAAGPPRLPAVRLCPCLATAQTHRLFKPLSPHQTVPSPRHPLAPVTCLLCPGPPSGHRVSGPPRDTLEQAVPPARALCGSEGTGQRRPHVRGQPVTLASRPRLVNVHFILSRCRARGSAEVRLADLGEPFRAWQSVTMPTTRARGPP